MVQYRKQKYQSRLVFLLFLIVSVNGFGIHRVVRSADRSTKDKVPLSSSSLSRNEVAKIRQALLNENINYEELDPDNILIYYGKNKQGKLVTHIDIEIEKTPVTNESDNYEYKYESGKEFGEAADFDHTDNESPLPNNDQEQEPTKPPTVPSEIKDIIDNEELINTNDENIDGSGNNDNDNVVVPEVVNVSNQTLTTISTIEMNHNLTTQASVVVTVAEIETTVKSKETSIIEKTINSTNETSVETSEQDKSNNNSTIMETEPIVEPTVKESNTTLTTNSTLFDTNKADLEKPIEIPVVNVTESTTLKEITKSNITIIDDINVNNTTDKSVLTNSIEESLKNATDPEIEKILEKEDKIVNGTKQVIEEGDVLGVNTTTIPNVQTFSEKMTNNMTLSSAPTIEPTLNETQTTSPYTDINTTISNLNVTISNITMTISNVTTSQVDETTLPTVTNTTQSIDITSAYSDQNTTLNFAAQTGNDTSIIGKANEQIKHWHWYSIVLLLLFCLV